MIWVIGLIVLAVIIANFVAKERVDDGERLPGEEQQPIGQLLFEFRDLSPDIELEVLLGLYFEKGRGEEDRNKIYQRLERLTASHSGVVIRKRMGLIEEQEEHRVLLNQLLIENGFDTAMELAEAYPEYIHQQRAVALIWELICHLGSVARKNFIRYLEQSEVLNSDEKSLFSEHKKEYQKDSCGGELAN